MDSKDVHIVELGDGNTLELPSYYSNEQVNDAVQTYIRQQEMYKKDPSLAILENGSGSTAAFQQSLSKPWNKIAQNAVLGLGGGLTDLFHAGRQAALDASAKEHIPFENPQARQQRANEAEQYRNNIDLQREAAKRLPSANDYLAQAIHNQVQTIPGYAVGGLAATELSSLAHALQPILERTPQALRSAANTITRPFSPTRQANELANELGAGATSPAHANELIASEIHGAHQARVHEGGDIFEHVKNQLGEKNIFNNIYPTAEFFDKDTGLAGFEGRIGDLYEKFKDNPNLINSHNLSKAIGREKEGLNLSDTSNRRIKERLDKAYNKITGYHESFLGREYPAALEDWRSGQGYYQRHVDPYRQEQFRDIAKGDLTNPGAGLHGRFRNPQYIRNQEGQLVPGNVEKVFSDLTPEAANRVLYSATRGHELANRPTQYAQALREALGGGEQGGYRRFAPENIDQRIRQLQSAIRRRNALGIAGAAGLGYLAKDKVVNLLRDLLINRS